ncbi:MAG: hypothetical protein H7A51_14485 [Akkermansiaceae bacterium]|nr:hypothetical protein [Akkermansiaceae bacterium]
MPATNHHCQLGLRLDYVHHNPGEERAESQYLDPAYLDALGYTGQVSDRHVQAAVSLESYLPDLWKDDPETRDWITSYADRIRTEFQRTKKAGLACFAWTDFVVLPKSLLERFADELTLDVEIDDPFDVKGKVRPNIKSTFTQEVLRAQIREIFATFPELDGLVVRVGETYLHNLPHHTGGDPIVHGPESHVDLLTLMREEICEKLGKTLVYRTWMSGIDELAEPYLEATNQVKPHPNLYFVIKHCIGDFHRTHRFSPPLGTGKHQQLIEIQCQREYEGKGAFPNFIAAGVIDGFEEYDNLMPAGEIRSVRELVGLPQTAGILTWSRGGGWQGPYIKDELWCDINARVLTMWAQNPELPTDDIVDRVLRDLKFSDRDRPKMKEILDLSAKAIVRGVTGTRGDIDTLWTRDEYFGGFEAGSPFMTRAVESVLAGNQVQATLAEMAEAVAIWKQIETLSMTLEHADAQRLAFIRTSCSYGRIYQEIVYAGWTVILLGEQGVRSGEFDVSGMRQAIESYQRGWENWNKLSQRPECSTLYQDTYCHYVADKGMIPADGMGTSVSRYAKLIPQRVDRPSLGHRS